MATTLPLGPVTHTWRPHTFAVPGRWSAWKRVQSMARLYCTVLALMPRQLLEDSGIQKVARPWVVAGADVVVVVVVVAAVEDVVEVVVVVVELVELVVVEVVRVDETVDGVEGVVDGVFWGDGIWRSF